MLDVKAIREDPAGIAASLARRGVDGSLVERVRVADVTHREALLAQETLRATVKSLSREVGEAKRSGDQDAARRLSEESRRLGDDERAAAESVEKAAQAVRDALYDLPNVPSADAPDGADADDNVEVASWWRDKDAGAPAPEPLAHQRVPHWEIGEELGILDLERGARLAGSMFPLYRAGGARLLRALTSYALSRHADAYEEIRPPTLVLTETMVSTGHLPKFADEAYHVERDDLWAIPTAEVPLTSMHRGEILEESRLPIKMTAVTQCFRREAGAAGRDTRGVLRVHEFEKVELFAYCTPEQATDAHRDILSRAEGLLRELGLPYRVLDLCTADLGASSKRTFDLEVYAPGSDRWLEVSSVSWFGDYQARRANVRYRPRGGGPPALVHTVNGSALAWSRIFAALLEWGRRVDGTVELPSVLAPWMGSSGLVLERA